MKKVKVLGSGCHNCQMTMELIASVARTKGIEIELEKVENFLEIARHGVVATPAVVIDGHVVHAGGVPHRTTIERWFE